MFQKIPNSPTARPGIQQPNNGYAADFLMGRIVNQPQYSTYMENETDFPLATGSVHANAEVGQNQAVAQMPLSRITIYPGAAAYASDSPLITADGAPVKSTGTGSWGQLYAAGRMP